ncbi:iron ABC transporter permease [Rhodovastum atsumiense]|uniref:Iron ABC transporter permease n=1 Tax=Rhodovastum atsumiense TaxID=504468 RepID=A0A5M6J0U0_9PROT|nr:iron ABC transporter permease [Rhodovastum atsumiense]
MVKAVLLFGLLPLLVAFLSLLIGRYPLAPDAVLTALGRHLFGSGQTTPDAAEVVVVTIRLPRIAAALLVGAALATAGAAFQGIFRNPLVSPDILGVAAGAGFGAALAILLGAGPVGIQAAAFGGGLLAVTTTWLITRWHAGEGDAVLVLILAGVIVGTVFSALIALVKFVADPNNVLPVITFWLMGSLAAVSGRDLLAAGLPVGAGLACLLLLRWRLNLLAFGDEEARALGVEVERLRFAVVVGATLMTAAAVAISGVIGLVGLVVPHVTRLLVGPDHRVLLPAAAVMGGTFLLLVDDVARSLVAAEIPLGILTSLIGAPFFLSLLGRARNGGAA